MKKIKLEFSREQLAVINHLLIEAPYKLAAPIIQDINAQIQRSFDESVGDGPTGHTPQKDQFSGD
jgi:hypothetical protein